VEPYAGDKLDVRVASHAKRRGRCLLDSESRIDEFVHLYGLSKMLGMMVIVGME
jgi:hypothetical protein